MFAGDIAKGWEPVNKLSSTVLLIVNSANAVSLVNVGSGCVTDTSKLVASAKAGIISAKEVITRVAFRI